jgi:antirestriction protein
MEEALRPGVGPEQTGNEHVDSAHVEAGERGAPDWPRIYVASLADYNEGVLHGAWIDATQESALIHDEINRMLSKSPTTSHAEEFAVHDFEGFGHYRPSEYERVETISRVARGIAEYGSAFGAWAAQCDNDDEQLDNFEDAYLGDYDSVTSYAEQLLDDIGLTRIVEEHVPEELQSYVEVIAERLANDLVLGGDITAIEHAGGVWIFDGTF